jgi:hypothetical protein
MEFTARPPNYPSAIEAYRSALNCLPACVEKAEKSPLPEMPPTLISGIQEVTEEEAAAIEIRTDTQEPESENAESAEREDIGDQIRECTKACWGNLAASYLAIVRGRYRIETPPDRLGLQPRSGRRLH